MREVAIAFLAASLALIGWGIQQRLERLRRVRSVKAALAVEVAVLTASVRHNRYADEFRAHAKDIREAGQQHGYAIFLIHITQPYFAIYQSNAASLGDFEDDHLVVDIVAFYQTAMGLVDACSEEAQPDPNVTPMELAAKRYDDMAVATDRLCAFGDNLSARLATRQVADQIKIAASRLSPGMTSLVAGP